MTAVTELLDDVQGVTVVIPARYGSSRFPGKPLVPICGMPLVLRVHERVARAVPSGQIIVATDDDRIRNVCEAAGVRVAMTCSGCITGTDRVWEAVRDIPREAECELIVNVQGDEPLVAADDIIAVIRAKRRHPDKVINAMCSIGLPAEIESENVPKVVATDDGRLVYMSRAPVPFVKRAGSEQRFRRQVCIYAFSRVELQAFAAFGRQSWLELPEDIEILRFLDMGIGVQMVDVAGASVAVDVPSDVARVEAIMALEARR